MNEEISKATWTEHLRQNPGIQADVFHCGYQVSKKIKPTVKRLIFCTLEIIEPRLSSPQQQLGGGHFIFCSVSTASNNYLWPFRLIAMMTRSLLAREISLFLTNAIILVFEMSSANVTMYNFWKCVRIKTINGYFSSFFLPTPPQLPSNGMCWHIIP